ncbi:hypothetical protein LCGC14_0737580 [marine sediment metagenome]|uniref:Uncharacterized protein n=1 Tax=marine sediment metagenome TaxID=412755 RepID=A0A0F9QSK9_9ZZZZ
MADETTEYLNKLEAINKAQENKINELSGYTSNAVMNQTQDTNLIVWQLELDNILERIEHLLKGDIIKSDAEGNAEYVTPTDNSLVILNDYGVQLIMNVVSFYLNRNTILSNYSEERINNILYDLGNELADVVYINYETMGMTTMEKKSRHELLILNILHTIESCYNRSLGGGERDSLRSARVVTQSLTPSGSMGNPMAMRKKHMGGILNPRNWKL